jgi:capsular exopolysaccharide synthesis family protein
MVTPKYVASVKMYVKGIKDTEVDFYRSIGAAINLVPDHMELLKSNVVLKRVIEALKLDELPLDYEKYFASPLKAKLIDITMGRSNSIGLDPKREKEARFNAAMARLKASINATPSIKAMFFWINVSDYDAKRAVLIANSLSRSYLIFDVEQQIQDLKLKYGEKHSIIKQLEEYIKRAEKTLHGRVISEEEIAGPSSVKIVEQALNARYDPGVNKPLLLILAVFSGIVIGIILTFILEYFDHSIKSQKDIESFLGVPYLCSLPSKNLARKGLLHFWNSPVKHYQKAIEDLSERIRMHAINKNYNTLLIASVDKAEDSASIIADIGIYLTQQMKCKCLMIDADFRTRSLTKAFKMSGNIGLVDLIQGSASSESVTLDFLPNLDIITTGKTDNNSASLLHSSILANAIKETKSYYDIILINGSDMTNYPDSLILSSFVDAMILVINEGEIRREAVQRILIPYKHKNTTIMGAILNNRKYVVPNIIYKIT